MARDLLPFDRQPWADRAACLSVGPRLFFTDRGESTRQAKAVCEACPVREACAEYALVNDIRHGIFGGLSEWERRRIRKTRKAAA